MWGSEALACGWLERSMEERTSTTGLVAWCNHEVCRRDLSQGMRCIQTCATTQSEQTLMVPIEAPPFSGLRVNYNIFSCVHHFPNCDKYRPQRRVDCLAQSDLLDLPLLTDIPRYDRPREPET